MINNIVNKRDFQYFYKKKLKYMWERKHNEDIKNKRDKCMNIAIVNPNENWFKDKLKTVKFRFKRQCIWGYRIYDFWCHELGCAIEIDGESHRKDYDRYRDVYNYLRSGIVILRVQNKNEQDAQEAIQFLYTLEKWKDRRIRLGIEGKGVHPVDITNPNDVYWSK